MNKILFEFYFWWQWLKSVISPIMTLYPKLCRTTYFHIHLLFIILWMNIALFVLECVYLLLTDFERSNCTSYRFQLNCYKLLQLSCNFWWFDCTSNAESAFRQDTISLIVLVLFVCYKYIYLFIAASMWNILLLLIKIDYPTPVYP